LLCLIVVVRKGATMSRMEVTSFSNCLQKGSGWLKDELEIFYFSTRDMRRVAFKLIMCLNRLEVSFKIGKDCTARQKDTSLWSETPGSVTNRSHT